MKIVKSPAEMKNLSLTHQRGGRTVGLVPTMGALHQGHLSLLAIAKRDADLAVMSIFVNPTQFGPQEDFQEYPRSFEADCAKAEAAGCDIIFAPSVSDMYPQHYNTYVTVEGITETLCGKYRPGHFRGVTTVVLKLFNIVNPNVAVFGQKDAQQVLVLKRMIHDLNCSVKLQIAPVVREPDGLALSSRNLYLTSSERANAPLIYRGLSKASELYQNGERSVSVLYQVIYEEYSNSEMLEIEYIELVDIVELKPVTIITSPVLVAVACRTLESKTRLIDNIVLGGAL